MTRDEGKKRNSIRLQQDETLNIVCVIFNKNYESSLKDFPFLKLLLSCFVYWGWRKIVLNLNWVGCIDNFKIYNLRSLKFYQRSILGVKTMGRLWGSFKIQYSNFRSTLPQKLCNMKMTKSFSFFPTIYNSYFNVIIMKWVSVSRRQLQDIFLQEQKTRRETLEQIQRNSDNLFILSSPSDQDAVWGGDFILSALMKDLMLEDFNEFILGSVDLRKSGKFVWKIWNSQQEVVQSPHFMVKLSRIHDRKQETDKLDTFSVMHLEIELIFIVY